MGYLCYQQPACQSQETMGIVKRTGLHTEAHSYGGGHQHSRHTAQTETQVGPPVKEETWVHFLDVFRIDITVIIKTEDTWAHPSYLKSTLRTTAAMKEGLHLALQLGFPGKSKCLCTLMLLSLLNQTVNLNGTTELNVKLTPFEKIENFNWLPTCYRPVAAEIIFLSCLYYAWRKKIYTQTKRKNSKSWWAKEKQLLTFT